MENLFSYGTLQNETVQKETFGRLLNGFPDSLEGYNLSMIKIEDQSVVTTSGKTHHPIIKFTNDKTDTIKGMVFKITESELMQADEYEVDEYKRTLVELKSGKNAWVYVSNS